MNDGERDDLWVADADGDRCADAARLSRPVPLAGRPRLVAGRQAHRLQPDQAAGRRLRDRHAGDGRRRHRQGPRACSARGSASFTAGARYSPDGRRVVFEKVHKTGRGPDADIDAGHPERRATRPAGSLGPRAHRPAAVRRHGRLEPGRRSASSTPPSPSRTTRRRTCSGSAPRAAHPTRLTAVADDGGFAAEPGLAAGRHRRAVQRPARRRVGEPGAADRGHRRERSRLGVRRRRRPRAAPAGATDALTSASAAAFTSRT